MSIETTENQGIEEEIEASLAELPADSQPLLIEPSPNLPGDSSSQTQEKIAEFIRDPINYTVKLLQPYQSILIALGIALLAIVSIKLIFTLLSAVFSVATSIPIFSPLVELVGIGYTGWFIYRYLLKAETRQELSQKISQIKEDFLGNQN